MTRHINEKHQVTDKIRDLVMQYMTGDISLYRLAKSIGCGSTTAYILSVRVMKEAYQKGNITIKK